MFPFLVNSVLLFFFLSLSFKSPPFTSPRNQKRARYRIKTTITLRLDLYQHFFFCFGIFILSAHCYLFWPNHSMDSRRNIRRRYENCCVLFSLWLCCSHWVHALEYNREELESERRNTHRRHALFLDIYESSRPNERSTMGERKSIEWRGKKNNITSIELLIPLSDNLDRLAFDWKDCVCWSFRNVDHLKTLSICMLSI